MRCTALVAGYVRWKQGSRWTQIRGDFGDVSGNDCVIYARVLINPGNIAIAKTFGT
jgi:hypothetical protein